MSDLVIDTENLTVWAEIANGRRYLCWKAVSEDGEVIGSKINTGVDEGQDWTLAQTHAVMTVFARSVAQHVQRTVMDAYGD